MSLKFSGQIPDTHVDDHDERAYQLCLKVFKDIQISELVILGDFADFYSVMSHQKDAEMARYQLEKEVEAVNTKLDELDDLFPKAKKIYIQGNHEYRLERYISSRCPELFNLIKCEELFKFDARWNWLWIPYGPHQLYSIMGGKLHARHEPLASGVNHARGSIQKAGISHVYGHVHQRQECESVMLDGSRIRAYCPGWLGDQRKPSFQYVKNHHQWSLGFSVTTHMPNGNWFSNLCSIIDYQTVLGKTLYKG